MKQSVYTRNKLKEMIYFFFNPTEWYEKAYVRHYLKISNPEQVTVCNENEYNLEKKYDILKRVLSRGLKRDLYLEIMECINHVRLNETSKEIVEKYNHMLQGLQNLTINTFTSERWRTIATMLYTNGLFRAGAICREKSQQRLFIKKGHYATKVLAYLENGDLQNAKINIDKICSNPILLYSIDYQVEYYKFYYNLMNQSGTNQYDVELQSIDNWDADYSALMNDQNVRIIGPAFEWDGRKKDGEYIIRINCMEEEVEEHKADVLYYSPMIAESIFGDLGLEKVRHHKICIYDYDGYKKQIKKWRYSYAYDEVFYMGTMHTAPHIVMDILLNGGKKVCVEGITLYMSKQIYAESYCSYEEAKVIRKYYIYAFARHNLQSQFLFLKNLYHAGKINVDDTLKGILDLSIEEYLKGMEELYTFYQQ